MYIGRERDKQTGRKKEEQGIEVGGREEEHLICNVMVMDKSFVPEENSHCMNMGNFRTWSAVFI